MKKEKFRVKSLKLKVFLTAFFTALLIFNFQLLTCEAKIYIDITSPAIKNFPSLFRNSAAQRGDR